MTVYSEISLFWLLPIVLGSYTLSYFYYKKQAIFSDTSKLKRWGLVALRGTVLFLLATLLLNILIERKVSKTEAPVFIVLSDNSSSMLNYQDSAKVKQRLESSG